MNRGQNENNSLGFGHQATATLVLPRTGPAGSGSHHGPGPPLDGLEGGSGSIHEAAPTATGRLNRLNRTVGAIGASRNPGRRKRNADLRLGT